MQRRQFLQAASAAAALGGPGLWGHGRLWANPAGGSAPDGRLLLVFLRGGYDGLSLLVPAARGFYAEVRPRIAIPVAAPAQPGALPLDTDWALHPALAASVLPLVQRGEACFVPFAGSHNTTRSHFETQDSIELGLPEGLTQGASRDFQSGFLNRLAQQLAGRAAIAFTDQLPLALRGPLPVANVSLKGAPRPGELAALQAAMRLMYQQHPLKPQVDSAFDLRDQVARQLADEQRAQAAMGAAATTGSAAPAAAGQAMAPAAPAMAGGMAPGGMAAGMAPPASASMANEMAAASRNAVTPRGFELEARRVARLMRERYSLGFVDVGGWDTHADQGAATGQLANRLEELGRGLAAYASELGPEAWRRTVVVVLSEFGRTVRENGTRGTDHGHGTVYWVLGGGLLGRQAVRGEQRPVDAGHLFQNRDLPVLTDYRGLLAGLLARQFGLGPGALDRVFAGVTPIDLGLL